jgi:hypothetical protein
MVPHHIARAPLNVHTDNLTNNKADVPSNISHSGIARVIQGTVWFYGTVETRDGDVDHWVMK